MVRNLFYLRPRDVEAQVSLEMLEAIVNSVNYLDCGISLRNGNLGYQSISRDYFKYGMSQSSDSAYHSTILIKKNALLNDYL